MCSCLLLQWALLYINFTFMTNTTFTLLTHTDTLPGHWSLLVSTPRRPVEPQLPWRAAGPHRLMPGCHWWWRSSPCLSPCCWHLSGGILAAEERRLPAAPFSERLCPFYWWGDDTVVSVYRATCLTITLSFLNPEPSYLCAFPSPFSSTLMISGSRWAGSLGLSRYNKTFLPYLLLMTSSREDRISWREEMAVLVFTHIGTI